MQETRTDYPEYMDRNGTRWAIIARPGELRFHSEHAPLTHEDFPMTKTLPSTKPTHNVDFFDSFTMQNQTAPCRIIRMSLSDNPQTEDMATVEVDTPVRKRIRVPITCLVDLSTGQRLPYPVADTNQ